MKTIVITGPEASGKSYLTAQLANRFNAHKVMEYARWYLPTLPRPYEFNDLLAISRGQERSMLEVQHGKSKREFLFIDTWAIVLMIWAEFKYGVSHKAFHAMLNRQEIDHFILCTPDLPWEEDPLRENPHDRDELYELYREKLEKYRLPYSVIQGDYEERLKQAISTVSEL